MAYFVLRAEKDFWAAAFWHISIIRMRAVLNIRISYENFQPRFRSTQQEEPPPRHSSLANNSFPPYPFDMNSSTSGLHNLKKLKPYSGILLRTIHRSLTIMTG